MSNSAFEGIPIEDRKLEVPWHSSNSENQHQQHSHSSQIQPNLRPWVGIRHYTNQLSPQLANPGFIRRSRLIYNEIYPQLIGDHVSWYVAIEPDSGDYFLNPNKALAQQQARQKHPQRLICTFQLITAAE